MRDFGHIFCLQRQSTPHITNAKMQLRARRPGSIQERVKHETVAHLNEYKAKQRSHSPMPSFVCTEKQTSERNSWGVLFGTETQKKVLFVLGVSLSVCFECSPTCWRAVACRTARNSSADKIDQLITYTCAQSVTAALQHYNSLAC